MIAITPASREVVDARWDAVRRKTASTSAERPAPRPSNVRAILDLGTLTYFTFRGRMYGVPPLPWREGEHLLDAWLELQSYGEAISRTNHRQYYACVKRITEILWKNTRMIGHVPRVLKTLRIFRNPYDIASESELMEVAVFFLGRRTTKTVGFKPGAAPLVTS